MNLTNPVNFSLCSLKDLEYKFKRKENRKMSYVLILGAGSDIAKALIKKYAQNKFDIYLAGRNWEELNKDANDLQIRYGINAKPVYFDALDYNSHRGIYDSLEQKPIGVICAVGYVGDQQKGQNDFWETHKIINTNYLGCVSILDIVANDLESRKEGFIVGISSVAGDRGRQSNYIYGSAKAGFTAYLSGLRNRLYKSNVHVLTVKPGFVATKMTRDMKLPEKLTAQPEEVANDIYNAQQKKKDIIYTKWFWFCIMMIIKHIPESIFKKKNL